MMLNEVRSERFVRLASFSKTPIPFSDSSGQGKRGCQGTPRGGIFFLRYQGIKE
jgi:hypothetical protein